MGLLGSTGDPAQSLAAIGAPFAAVLTKTAAYTVAVGDRGRVLACSGTWTLGLPAVATAGAGFSVTVKNTGTGTITLDPSGSETLDGAATGTLLAGHSVILSCTGTAWLTLGRPVTQTATDTTAGRLLKVGDFGLGAISAPTTVTNLDDGSLASGTYLLHPTNTTSGTWPPGMAAAYAALDVRRISSVAIVARLTPLVTGKGSWIRSYNSGTWTAWVQDTPIVGTVSQSAGTPTGAVIERSNNANGEYVRFADGTQICTTTVLTQTGAETSATFAAAFAAAPRILCACSGGTVGFARSTGVTPSGVDVSAYNTSAARIAGYVAIIAIGRWF